ncbi:MAG: universal stress protein [Acidimicrobiales bacterium]
MQKRVVVGIGDHEFSAPLQWAIDCFYLTGASLCLIHCISARLSTEMPYPIDGHYARGKLKAEEVEAFARECGAALSVQVLEGFAGEILVKNSIDSDILVVGSSRARHVLHAPGNSVVTHCVRHSSCPLVIVPTRTSANAVNSYLGRA